MDVKYGISAAFTLDMTLIPDFGQVQSDNQVLNLSPFEVKFNENRTFFIEGTELFSKGNLFYSRRIGGQPLHYWDVQDNLASNEHIVSNPAAPKLINATKISGRTAIGLGIGVLNAVSNAQFATIEDNTGKIRTEETSPLTNYNINFFNVDMVYTWQFALGSFINIGWKNAIENFDPTLERDYFKNLKSTLASDQLNNFSVKVIYFLDCAKLKKKPTV